MRNNPSMLIKVCIVSGSVVLSEISIQQWSLRPTLVCRRIHQQLWNDSRQQLHQLQLINGYYKHERKWVVPDSSIEKLPKAEVFLLVSTSRSLIYVWNRFSDGQTAANIYTSLTHSQRTSTHDNSVSNAGRHKVKCYAKNPYKSSNSFFSVPNATFSCFLRSNLTAVSCAAQNKRKHFGTITSTTRKGWKWVKFLWRSLWKSVAKKSEKVSFAPQLLIHLECWNFDGSPTWTLRKCCPLYGWLQTPRGEQKLTHILLCRFQGNQRLGWGRCKVNSDNRREQKVSFALNRNDFRWKILKYSIRTERIILRSRNGGGTRWTTSYRNFRRWFLCATLCLESLTSLQFLEWPCSTWKLFAEPSTPTQSLTSLRFSLIKNWRCSFCKLLRVSCLSSAVTGEEFSTCPRQSRMCWTTRRMTCWDKVGSTYYTQKVWFESSLNCRNLLIISIPQQMWQRSKNSWARRIHAKRVW